MTEKMIVRQHMKITGQVQGVGFRYRARYAAVVIIALRPVVNKIFKGNNSI